MILKLVVNDPKAGKSYQKEVEKAKEGMLLGRKIGEAVEGSVIGLEGYNLKVTGGTDKDGFPMRPEIPGQRRVITYMTKGKGVRASYKGVRLRKRVAGNTVAANTMQVNSVVTQHGSKPLSEYGFVSTPKEAKEEGAKKGKKK
ncbi:MAG TPA: 30S ribosomal protein S6e [Candidatus Norongarragalinales archaeon]|nr:30S ribosomal protein S6e [Candidatus Norongarragalinales archaeon]